MARDVFAPLCAALYMAACSVQPYLGPDAGSASDAGGAGVDSGRVRDAHVAPDAPDAAGVDAALECECEPSSVCASVQCESGVCVRTPEPDGLECGELGDRICVAGACVVRGCGDGFREPGPLPEREACDDGNLLDGDACSAECRPTVLSVAARAGARDDPVGPAPSLAVDASGAVLVIWIAEEPDGAELRARRLSPAGVPLDADDRPLVISSRAPFGQTIHASVAGLASGWVVVWDEPNGDLDLAGVRLRVVDATGALRAPRIVSEERRHDQLRPRVAALSEGFVVVWEDRSQLLLGGPAVRVRRRLFSAGGTAESAELEVSSEPTRAHAEPALTSWGGTDYVVAWTDQEMAATTGLSVRARRFDRARATDAADLVIAGARASEPMATALDSAEALIAWRDGSVDPYGDLAARWLPRASGPASDPPLRITSSPEPFGPATTDWMASAAPVHGAGWVVAYHQWPAERGAMVALDPELSSEPPELPLARAWLAEGTVGHAAVARGSGGLFWVWSAARDEVGAGARRSVRAGWISID